MRIDRLSLWLLITLLLLTGCSHVPASKSGWQQVGTASWYGSDFHGRPTASGETYNMYGCSAAHKTLPLGTRVRVTNLANNRKVVVPINDRGPFVGDRIIDMSYGAARQLGMVKEGLAKVHIEVLQIPSNYTSRYILQFGAYTERHNAEKMADRLRTIGYSPSIEEASIQGKQLHRVRLGGFQSLEKAQGLAMTFRSKDIPCAVIGQ